MRNTIKSLTVGLVAAVSVFCVAALAQQATGNGHGHNGDGGISPMAAGRNVTAALSGWGLYWYQNNYILCSVTNAPPHTWEHALSPKTSSALHSGDTVVIVMKTGDCNGQVGELSTGDKLSIPSGNGYCMGKWTVTWTNATGPVTIRAYYSANPNDPGMPNTNAIPYDPR